MRLTLPLLLALCALAAHADDPKTWDNSDVWNRFEDKFDDSAKWQEVRQQLPAYPKPEHFIPIVLGARSSNHFYVDYPSVSVGTDGVVRYSMVVESPSGARTVNFEGIRCATGSLLSAATRLRRQIATGSSSTRPRRQAGSHGRSQVRPRTPGNTLDSQLII